ncbi:HNH endonuclease [Candidatus Saccharibacteria bacterium]|nr:HNH endonuclease [Candidatus Saccharibacteria bacterium]
MNKLTFLALLLFATAFSFAEESFAEVTYAETTYAEEVTAEITYAEMTFAEEIVSSSGLDFRDKHVEKMTAKELKNRYDGKYSVDWDRVILKFGAGTAIIVVTGTVGIVSAAVGAEPVAAIAFASCEGAAIGAAAGLVGGGLNGLIEALTSGDISKAQKGAIEGVADGFMWGAAIGAVTGGLGKFKSIKKGKIGDGNQPKLKSNFDEIKGCPVTAKGKCLPNHQYAGKRYPLEEKNPELARKYPNSIRFNEDGYPDFGPYVKASVRFDNPAIVCGKNKQCFKEGLKNKRFLEGNSGSGSSDFKAANERMGYSGPYPPSICGPKGNEACTWHHKEDGSLQLVPRDLHKAISHEGGASLIRQQIEHLYF